MKNILAIFVVIISYLGITGCGDCIVDQKTTDFKIESVTRKEETCGRFGVCDYYNVSLSDDKIKTNLSLPYNSECKSEKLIGKVLKFNKVLLSNGSIIIESPKDSDNYKNVLLKEMCL